MTVAAAVSPLLAAECSLRPLSQGSHHRATTWNCVREGGGCGGGVHPLIDDAGNGWVGVYVHSQAAA